jgi:hypothetical protein
MKLSRWIPWKFIIQRAARAYGVVDPITLLARLRRFAQPSEIQTPIELLRAGMVFHARGLINTRAIQNNLDWVWPFWVERQFNPNDAAFIPRAFSISHVNSNKKMRLRRCLVGVLKKGGTDVSAHSQNYVHDRFQ